jgi:hypothetical protein
METGVRKLVAPELPPWSRIIPARLLGKQVGAVVTPVQDEWQRRAASGLSALDNSSMLRVLFDLPVGVPIPLSRLSSWERGVLLRCPEGAVERQRGIVTRLACPPVKVDLVVVRSYRWRSGLYWSSQFGPFCRRVLVLPSLPSGADRENLELEARLYGIGVTSDRAETEGWLVPPAPFKPQRLSSGQWLFQERAYAAMLADQPSGSGPTDQPESHELWEG